MTIQQIAPSGGTGSAAASLFNAANRGGSADGNKFAATFRDSIDRTTEHSDSHSDEMQTAPVKKHHPKHAKNSDDDQPASPNCNPDALPVPAKSSDAAQTDAADVQPEQTAESAQTIDPDAKSATSASLLSGGLPHLTGMLRGMHGAQNSDGGAAGVQDQLAGNGNELPGGGKELPPGLQLMMETGITSPFNPDISGMPAFSETGMLTDVPLPGTGSDQAGQNPAATVPSPLLSALTAPRDSRGVDAETSATAGNLQLYSNAETGSDAWLEDFGTKIQWLQNLKHTRADLTLHPAELGSIEIRIVTEDNNTKVTIVTQTVAARDIIESTLPRLREMLASQGMALDQGSVSQQTSEDRRQEQAGNRGDNLQHSEDELTEITVGQQTRLLAAGQIDHYV